MKALAIILALAPAVAVAQPATQQNIDACIQNLSAQTTNIHSVMQACAGVQDVALVTNCVVTLRQKHSLIMPDASVACAGVKDLPALESCITTEKNANLTDDEASIVCNQK